MASNAPFVISSSDPVLQSSTDSDSTLSQESSQPLSISAKVLVFHAFLSFVICSMDRINIAVAIIPMAAKFSWSHSRQGIIQSIFFVGYMLTMVPGGRWADNRGGRLILAGGVVVWSLATAMIPIAAPFLPALLLVRIVLGAGEGVAMPSMNALVAAAVPEKFRARSLGLVYSGMYAGSIIGLIGTPVLLRYWGYHEVFYVSGAIGLVWAALFVLTTKDPDRIPLAVLDPSPDTSLSLMIAAPLPAPSLPPAIAKPSSQSCDSTTGLLDRLESDESTEEVHPGILAILAHRAVWAIIVAQFCCTWGYFVLLAWMPTYLHIEHGLDVSSSAWLSTFPWFAMFAFSNVGGILADKLLDRGLDVTKVRKIMQGVGFLGPCLSLLTLMVFNSLKTAIVLIALALATSSFSQSGVYANHQDIGPRVAGTLLGVSSTFASLPGLIGVWISGAILDATNKDWNAVFALAVVFYTFGLLFYTWFGTSRRIW